MTFGIPESGTVMIAMKASLINIGSHSFDFYNLYSMWNTNVEVMKWVYGIIWKSNGYTSKGTCWETDQHAVSYKNCTLSVWQRNAVRTCSAICVCCPIGLAKNRSINTWWLCQPRYYRIMWLGWEGQSNDSDFSSNQKEFPSIAKACKCNNSWVQLCCINYINIMSISTCKLMLYVL